MLVAVDILLTGYCLGVKQSSIRTSSNCLSKTIQVPLLRFAPIAYQLNGNQEKDEGGEEDKKEDGETISVWHERD